MTKKRDRIAKRFCLPTRGGEKPARRFEHREIIIEQANCQTVCITGGIRVALLVHQESIVKPATELTYNHTVPVNSDSLYGSRLAQVRLERQR